MNPTPQHTLATHGVEIVVDEIDDDAIAVIGARLVARGGCSAAPREGRRRLHRATTAPASSATSVYGARRGVRFTNPDLRRPSCSPNSPCA